MILSPELEKRSHFLKLNDVGFQLVQHITDNAEFHASETDEKQTVTQEAEDESLTVIPEAKGDIKKEEQAQISPDVTKQIQYVYLLVT